MVLYGWIFDHYIPSYLWKKYIFPSGNVPLKIFLDRFYCYPYNGTVAMKYGKELNIVRLVSTKVHWINFTKVKELQEEGSCTL